MLSVNEYHRPIDRFANCFVVCFFVVVFFFFGGGWGGGLQDVQLFTGRLFF